MAKYQWIVFDADGTLFDYDHAELSALTRTLESYGLQYNAEIHRFYVEINAHLWAKLEQGTITSKKLRVQRFEELAKAINADFDAQAFSRDYLLNLGADATLLPNAHGVVEHLSASFGLVLATNGIAAVQRSRFAASGFEPYFHSVVISDEIGISKPDPGFFVEMFSRMEGAKKHEALIVGDNLSSDIAGGSGFGIDTCWLNTAGQSNTSPFEPTYEIKSLYEVIDIAQA